MDGGAPTLGPSASGGALHHQSSHLNLSSAASNGNAPSSSRAATARASVPWTRRPSVFFALCALATTVLALMTHEGRSTTCERAPEYVVDDAVAKRRVAPCFVRVHNQLRPRKPLKHKARYQYWCLLSALGAPGDITIAFGKGRWKDWSMRENKTSISITSPRTAHASRPKKKMIGR